MIEQGIEEIKINPEWIRPDLQEESGEIKRVIVDFLKKEPTTENIRAVINALESAPLVDLSEEEWALLENADSHIGNVRPGHIEDVEKINDIYNSALPPEDRRDLKKTLAGFMNGSKMKAPTILRNKAGRLHLVSGNTRLMISRALRIRPKVVIGIIE